MDDVVQLCVRRLTARTSLGNVESAFSIYWIISPTGIDAQQSFIEETTTDKFRRIYYYGDQTIEI
jgi:hypothetical protein